MSRTKVGLVQIGDSFGGQYYFPYSAGLLQAYAEKNLPNPDAYEFAPIIYKRSAMGDIEKDLYGADIVFYSTYLWNYRISLEIARRIKSGNPKTINVFGGPQIPEKPERMEAFLREMSFVDIVSYGEGELPFLRVLEHFRGGDRAALPSAGFIGKHGDFVFTWPAEEVPGLDDIPSPYLSGVFDKLLQLNPGEKWQGLLETNRGCPHTCAFCYWGKKTKRAVKTFSIERVFQEIDWFSDNKVEFVFCCDANFGILDRDFEIVRKVVENKKRFKYPNAFSVQNTKNSKKKIFDLYRILNESGLQKGVNLALQSLNEQTLKFVERSNIDNKTYTELQSMFTKSNIMTFTDILLGLPGETYDSYADGISEIIHNGQHNRIQFGNLVILENTEMANEAYQSRYGMKTVKANFESHHTLLKEKDEVCETHSLVVATSAMPEEDWIKAKLFAWTASLMHFGKLLQLPFIFLHELGKAPYRELIEAFAIKDHGHPVLTGIVAAFEEKAREIRNGSGEFSPSKDWLNITWHSDELAYIKLCTEGLLDDFYREAEDRLKVFSDRLEPDYPQLISQAVNFNHKLLKQPFVNTDITVRADYNLWDVYQAVLKGDEYSVKKAEVCYTIDSSSQRWNNWQDWCRQVVWYGYKKGDYIYSINGTTA
ncbi:MAG: radical SAM protein [Nitrospirae bacterium]|nr:MAG: radical SAM protein [Nitrospirota bacterium]